MGFYGNVTNTSKTTFSFDLIYTTRVDMDLNANTDGVFLGRYVLINYDEEPIKGYYNPESDRFYNTSGFSATSVITPRPNVVYQNLHDSAEATTFYKWIPNEVGAGGHYEVITDNTPYANYFATDVKAYGRGYDSTAWVKRYDNATGAYKYVMIAELNAVIPTLHMVVNQPNTIPVTPYFDRDTTNIDYYLHMQSDFGNRIKKAQDNIKSDEVADRIVATWSMDSSGYQYYNESVETVPADIYYNNAGFDPELRTYMQDKVTYPLRDDKGNQIKSATGAYLQKTIDYSKNSIGYDMGQSGRLYGADADMGVYEAGVQADDIYDWYFRLPGIGNAICKMWDKVYDDRGNGKLRALNKALVREDTDEHLVTYDKQTLMGMINTTQDLLGYYFVPTNQIHYQGSSITNGDTTVTVTLNQEHEAGTYNATYPVLKCLFYTPVENNGPIHQYFHYAYTPTYESAEPIDNTITYYYKDENDVYHWANPATYQALNANNEDVSYGTYYKRNDKWTLVPLEREAEDSIYAIIAEIHNIIGTDADDVRNLETMNGTINIIKDIIANIDTQLMPGRLLKTSNSGVIETSDTYFPSATWDRDEVLDGNGNWVSRFATVKVLTNSENANQVAPEVNTIIDGAEQNVAKTIVSDNDKSNYGTSLVNSKKHTTNNLTLGTRNKWIQLHGNEDKDSIEFKHLESPIISRLRSEQAEGSEYLNMYNGVDDNGNVVLQDSTKFANFSTNVDATEIKVEPTTDTLSYVKGTNDQDDNRLTIPYIVADNAGHIVELGTKNFNVPHTFKYLTISDDNTDDIASGTRATPGTLEADQLTDTWTMAPQNKWIDISKDTDDGITIGHKYSELPAHDFMNDIVIDDDINGSKTTDCPFEFPMPITDNAGHIIDYTTKKIYIPYNYRNIALLAQSSSEDPITVSDGTQSADSTIDTFTFATGNQWIEARIDEDKITLAHAPIDADAQQNWEFKSTASSDWQDAVADGNELIIPTFEIDNAGHIVRNSNVKFYIPNNFRNISVVAATGEDVNSTQAEGKLEADSVIDTWSIAPQNKWLRVAADVDKDQITIGHSYSEQSAHNFADNVEIVSALDGTSQKDNEITFPTLKTDNAGHIIGYQDNTFYIPHTFKNIHLLAQSTASTAVAASDTKVEMDAENIVDTFTFATGNKWVQTTGDITNDRITFSHILSGVTAGEYGTDNNTALTPKFGDTFEVPGYKVDVAGHVTSSSEHTVMIPKGSYENNASTGKANVITGMTFEPTTGAIVTTSENIGTLVLTGYSLGSTASAAVIATDSLNTAIAKIEAQIKAETTARTSADTTLTNNLNKEIEDRKAADTTLTNNLNTEISNRSTADTTLTNNLNKEIEDRKTADGTLQTNINNEIDNRTQAIKDAISQIMDDLYNNYSITLKAPSVAISKGDQTETGVMITATTTEVDGDTYTYYWEDGVTTASREVTAAGSYKCTVTRKHYSHTSTGTSTISITINDLPVIEEETEEPTT